jgi:protein TonB
MAGLAVIGCESDVTDNVKEVEQQKYVGSAAYYLDGMRKDEAQEPPPPPPPPSPEALKNINSIAATAAGVSSEQEGTEVFKVVEQMPRFPGCENEPLSDQERKQCAQQKLLEFIYDNVRYPETAKKNNISGMVVVKFVVDAEGRVVNPEIVRDIGGGCGAEAVRVVKLMKEQNIRWVSGKHRGRNVSVQFNLPIRFALE